MQALDQTGYDGLVSLEVILNASQSSRTQSSRFLTEAFGSGVQHIAFQTDDIFRIVEQLRANGVELLDIPENYYDDLGARIGRSEEQIDRFGSLNIFHDGDGAGEYFQVYSTAFENRSFSKLCRVETTRGSVPPMLRCALPRKRGGRIQPTDTASHTSRRSLVGRDHRTGDTRMLLA
jgi:catechol 2,3-dioxygenase-like lactoylglutathione lyase family enzyme